MRYCNFHKCLAVEPKKPAIFHLTNNQRNCEYITPRFLLVFRFNRKTLVEDNPKMREVHRFRAEMREMDGFTYNASEMHKYN